MNHTLDYIIKKFELIVVKKQPTYIPNINRTIMLQTLRELDFKVGAEIGTQRGVHAELMLRLIPGLHLYCIDAWENYPRYRDFTRSLPHEYERAKALLAPYPECALIRKFSMDAVGDFEDNSLDFVYIDAAHDFKHVAEDVCEWARKVRVEGVVFGHDFKRPVGDYVCNVKDVIPGYCYAHNINPWFVLGQTGKNDGMYREGTQSWMFVRQETDKIWL